jgi:hypothetical protein
MAGGYAVKGIWRRPEPILTHPEASLVLLAFELRKDFISDSGGFAAYLGFRCFIRSTIWSPSGANARSTPSVAGFRV